MWVLEIKSINDLTTTQLSPLVSLPWGQLHSCARSLSAPCRQLLLRFWRVTKWLTKALGLSPSSSKALKWRDSREAWPSECQHVPAFAAEWGEVRNTSPPTRRHLGWRKGGLLCDLLLQRTMHSLLLSGLLLQCSPLHCKAWLEKGMPIGKGHCWGSVTETLPSALEKPKIGSAKEAGFLVRNLIGQP